MVAALVLRSFDLIQSPLLIAIVLSSTSLGVIIPVLKDAGETGSRFGQLVIGAGSIADFGAIILLSVFFSGKGGTGATLLLIGCLLGLAGAVYFAVRGAERFALVSGTLRRLQDTTAQIRVRGAVVLLVAFAALAESFGLEVILGAFAAGAVLTLVDQDEVMTHPFFRRKLEAMGFGLFIPVFFVTSGIRFDTSALFGSASTIAMVPLFLAGLVLARGLPALLYRGEIGTRKTVVAALLQATSLPFIVAATAIGRDLGLIDAAGSSAFIAAGLLSVLVFPLAGLTLLRGGRRMAPAAPASEDAPLPAM
jgi:Kef-type K+ transport system membrane component KefB